MVYQGHTQEEIFFLMQLTSTGVIRCVILWDNGFFSPFMFREKKAFSIVRSDLANF